MKCWAISVLVCCLVLTPHFLPFIKDFGMIYLETQRRLELNLPPGFWILVIYNIKKSGGERYIMDLLECRRYSRNEIVGIFHTDRMDSIKRSLDRAGYKYEITGRG